MAIWEKLVAEFPEVADYRWHLAGVWEALGNLLKELRRFDAAEKAYRTAVGIREKLVTKFPTADNRRHAWWAWEGLAKLLEEMHQAQQAKEAWRQALVHQDKLVQLDPKDAGCRNKLAWLLATLADPSLRNPTHAVELAKEAVALAPKVGTFWNTLGAAHYRAGNWAEAVAALDRSMKLSNGGDGFDWFFLAMAHWQLDNEEEARKWYDQAVRWMDKEAPQSEDLRRFRAEASELLGIKE